MAHRLAPSPQRRAVRALLRSRSAQAGACIIVFFLVLAIVGPMLAPYDPYQAVLRERFQPPGSKYWFGTDALGRDILSRLLYGSPVSVMTGIVVGLLAASVGVPVGIVAGYYGGRIDNLLMRAVDVILALPGLLLAIGIVAVLGPGLRNILFAVAIVALPAFARVARAGTLRIREMPYVESARAIGATALGIMWRHVLPNVASPLIVLFSLRVATAILTTTALGFLGMGVQPPEAEWGAMLSDARTYLRSAPHAAVAPGLAIMLLVLGFNLFGDGVRDALDPQLKELGQKSAR